MVSIDEIEVNQHQHTGKYFSFSFYLNLNFYSFFFRIRTRVYAQGFVVSLLTAAAIYHTIKDRAVEHDIHGKVIQPNK